MNLKNIMNEILVSKFGKSLSEEKLLHFQRSIIKIINTEHQKISYLQLDKEDLISYVYTAICEVKDKFDENRNVPLIAYANFIIKRRILDYAKFLKRDKRKITIQMINTYRSGVTEDGQTYLEKDIDEFSYIKSEQDERSKYIKDILKHFCEYEATKKQALIAKMLYQGYSQKEIMQKAQVTRKEILECKEKLKNLFIYFNKDISKL
ncbi:hypothetical protein [Spiroplasma sp. BIUS-1]|uniref:hypothetical protein n=1 Tax=Spiroplasma sp. BIUS-1 TaxID=216964 RepID=UPI0013995C21|nr:hypothetical protein [Spiroplasma sp. BIUS-1]QHX36285.1 hypothetical protein SBIUS_v1c00320 [Spiroplasma sp. BIUS-1]